MKLTANRVEEILKECVFMDLAEYESTPDVIKVEGIMNNYAFHPKRVANHAAEISGLLDELPDSFKTSGGGGMSFLNACMDKHDNHWGEHLSMEHLFVLGIAAGIVKCIFPKDMWRILPGGMPYYQVLTHK